MGHPADCERCAELEEEVAYLRSELGLNRPAEIEAALRSYLRRQPRRPGNHSLGVALIATLYAAKGRTLTREQILDACPSPSGKEDRTITLINVWVSAARNGIGEDAIENVWGRGYRLSAAGMAKIAEIIGDARAAA